MLNKNDIINLEITGMTSEGFGVGRHEGFAVFTAQTAPGDLIEAKILKVLKSYAYGKLQRIISPAACRITPDCPHFSQCGGCAYRHISYEAELALKEQRVRDSLTRIGSFEKLESDAIAVAKFRDHYRNKAIIPLALSPEGKLLMGFYAVNSHRVVDCDSCLLQPEEFTIAMQVFREWFAACHPSIYDEKTHTGLLRCLYMRKAEATGEIMVCPVANGNTLERSEALIAALRKRIPNLKSFILNTNTEKTNVALGKTCRTLFGGDFITDRLCGLRFEISPLSFYQVNHTQAEALYSCAGEYAGLTGDEILMDLYCGTGTIGLSLAGSAKKLIGVEIVPQAVEDAKRNARINGIDNAEFICSDAERAAAKLKDRGEKPNVIIIDPPRKGCPPGLIDTVAELSPERVVYVSCDPATLARDLKLFSEHGFAPKRLKPFDMFPATAHVETVVLLSHKNS